MSGQEGGGNTREETIKDREAYNIVTDTIAGPNVRLRDNLIQGISIFASLLVGAGIGALVTHDRLAGALVGAFAGLVLGLLGSGMVLMIYRGVRHIQGRHD